MTSEPTFKELKLAAFAYPELPLEFGSFVRVDPKKVSQEEIDAGRSLRDSSDPFFSIDPSMLN